MKPSISKLAHAIEHITPAQAAEVLAAAHAPHKTPEQIADDVIDAIDALIPWPALIPGWGLLLESADGPAVKALVHALLGHHAAHGARS